MIREFVHVNSGEVVKCIEGAPVVEVLKASPSWKEVTVKEKSEPLTTSPKKGDKT